MPRKSVVHAPRLCSYCGEMYIPKHATAQHYSAVCRAAAQRIENDRFRYQRFTQLINRLSTDVTDLVQFSNVPAYGPDSINALERLRDTIQDALERVNT
jgi:hypothetical protein